MKMKRNGQNSSKTQSIVMPRWCQDGLVLLVAMVVPNATIGETSLIVGR
jgi:hypothetical protein